MTAGRLAQICVVGLNHFTTRRAIVDLPTDDPADIILIRRLRAKSAVEEEKSSPFTSNYFGVG
jgi:hypothetical protein